MSDQRDIDSIVADKLKLPTEAVRTSRMLWNNNTIMHEVFTHRFNQKIAEVCAQLETVKPENLAAKQAELGELRRGLKYCTQKET